MNLEKLFQMQKVLRDRINYNEPDRFNKLVLALLVELGECANEWRGFKFWSKDQEPRIAIREKCPKCNGNGMVQIGVGIRGVKVCDSCDNPRGGVRTTNPLLEEYVDCLHFVLEIGLELGYNPISVRVYQYSDISRQFKELFWEVADLDKSSKREDYIFTFQKFIGLGEMLGFTWEQIEQGYLDKNKVNHDRQDSGVY